MRPTNSIARGGSFPIWSPAIGKMLGNPGMSGTPDEEEPRPVKVWKQMEAKTRIVAMLRNRPKPKNAETEQTGANRKPRPIRIDRS